MVTVYRQSNWKIAVYGREHGIPHFHIEGAEFRCSVGIMSLELVIGTVPMAVLNDAIAWAATRQEALMQQWQELNG